MIGHPVNIKIGVIFIGVFDCDYSSGCIIIQHIQDKLLIFTSEVFNVAGEFELLSALQGSRLSNNVCLK